MKIPKEIAKGNKKVLLPSETKKEKKKANFKTPKKALRECAPEEFL